MSYYSKEVYEGKKRWREIEDEKNMKKAIKNGAPVKQVKAIIKLCEDRHYIHINNEKVFISESSDGDKIGKMLNDVESSQININVYLQKAGLSPINYTYNFIDDTCNDYTYEYEDMTYEEALEKTMDVMEQFDKDIIKYIKEFDERYDTDFAPSGIGRMYDEDR